MLKTISRNTKCAEIHCDGSAELSFSIQCICGLSLRDYELFQQHFSTIHMHKSDVFIINHDPPPEELHSTELQITDIVECLDEPLLVLCANPAPSTIEETECDMLTATAVDITIKQIERRPYKPSNKLNMCTYCGRSFRRRHLLDTHLNIHTGRKPHQCEMCGKQFRAVTTLSRHLRTHKQREALQCKHCEKQFTHRSALLSHELRHTQVRRWACNNCDKCFYTRNQMDTHQRKMHANSKTIVDIIDGSDCKLISNLPFACELCDQSYRSASMLSTHKLRKHYRLAKYCCEQCDKKFMDDVSLENHQQIHIQPMDSLK